MDKGVEDPVVEPGPRRPRRRGPGAAALHDWAEYPGETEDEARATLALLLRRTDSASASLTPFQRCDGPGCSRIPTWHGIVLELDPLPRRVRLRHTVRGMLAGAVEPLARPPAGLVLRRPDPGAWSARRARISP